MHDGSEYTDALTINLTVFDNLMTIRSASLICFQLFCVFQRSSNEVYER